MHNSVQMIFSVKYIKKRNACNAKVFCVCSLTQQEQALAQSQSQGGGPLPPGGGVAAGGGGGGGEVGGGVEGHPVDILQMLAKARNEYDKVGTSAAASKRSMMCCGNYPSHLPGRTNGPAKWFDA
jgi:hypothetical protein